jgi:hypothetical protein
MESIMRCDDQKVYFTRRARQERERAGICKDNSVALIHLKMADEYDRRVQAEEGLRIVGES